MKKLTTVILAFTILSSILFSISANAAENNNEEQKMPQEHLQCFYEYYLTYFPWYADVSDFATFAEDNSFTKVCDYADYTIYRYNNSGGDAETYVTVGPAVFKTPEIYSDFYTNTDGYAHYGTGCYLINDRETLSLTEAYEKGIFDVLNADEFFEKTESILGYSYYFKGDLDGNRILNVRDVTLLQKQLVQETDIEYVYGYDMNSDKEIDVKDVTDLQKCIAGYVI